MAHVFTLEATDHLVPRWFSEGVSVFEEWRSGPNPGVRIPMSVYKAMADDRLLPISELDEGFIRPTYEEQVIVSYMQAGLVCQYIDQTYGPEKLRGMLAEFKDGALTAAAVETVLEMTPAEFDERFADFVTAEHGEILANLPEWQNAQAEIGKHLGEENWSAIIALAEELIELHPRYVEPDSPYLSLAKAAEETGDQDTAINVLEQFWQHGGYAPGPLKRLAGWLYEQDRGVDAAKVYRTINLIDPLDGDAHALFGDLLLEQDRPSDALREYSVALALDPHDKAGAYYRVAKAQFALGDQKASQGQLLLALDVAPNYRPAQRLLLEVMRANTDNKAN